jgi:hypothetical protein
MFVCKYVQMQKHDINADVVYVKCFKKILLFQDCKNCK